jgi:hypothetical protein
MCISRRDVLTQLGLGGLASAAMSSSAGAVAAVGPTRLIDHLARHDIVVAGPFGAADHYIRVSLGTPPEMREFCRAWDLMPAHAMSM